MYVYCKKVNSYVQLEQRKRQTIKSAKRDRF